jgi:hypothetical protein
MYKLIRFVSLNKKTKKEQLNMEKRQYSFLVDIGKTMIDTNRISSEGKDSQRLYCKCGASKEIKNKAKRFVVKKHDTTVEDKHSVESIKCDKCSTVYDQKNKIFLLIPDEDEIYKINFKIEEKNGDVFLLREKIFARFNSSNDKLNDNIVRTDFIKFNKKTQKTSIFLSKPTLDKSMTQQKQTDANDTSEEVGLGKIQRLDHFFSYYDFASYFGLTNIFSFFNKIDEVISDLDQIKKMVPTIAYTYNNRELIEEVNQNTGESTTFINEDSGYGDGKKNKKSLNIGSYLSRFVELSKVFLCVADFPSITTILLTKKAIFFKDFIHSKNILSADIYTKNGATSPGKILEITMNYDTNGNLKAPLDNKRVNPNKEADSDLTTSYLRVSPLIYKNIMSPSDIDVLLSIYRKRYLTKTDIETLFQNYEADRLYKFYRALDRERIDDNIPFYIKQIKHILNRELDNVQNGQTNFIHLYTDTLRTMGLLELNENYIYNIKDVTELKKVHDDLAARFNAIKDAKKAEFYKKSVEEFKEMNMVVGDVGFSVVSTLENLNKEGMTMGHCVYTYLDKVINRNYLAVHVQHLISNERATLGLIRNSSSLEFEQLKGYQNSRATGEMIDSVIEFLQINKIKSSNRGDLTKSPGSQKRMHDYLSDEEVAKIKKQRAEKEEKEKEKAKKEGREYVPTYVDNSSKNKKKGIFGNLW